MEIKKTLIYKHLHDLAIEQLAEEYRTKGYKVEQEKSIGDYQADLLLTKGDEKIVIEVKSGTLNKERKEKLAQLADYINGLGGYRFKVVIARPPEEKKITIDHMSFLLFNFIINSGIPEELMELSTHTSIEEFSEVVVNSVDFKVNGEIYCKGYGVVEVELQYGSHKDQDRGTGHKAYSTFPFDFDVLLMAEDGKLVIADGEIEVDTSSHFE